MPLASCTEGKTPKVTRKGTDDNTITGFDSGTSPGPDEANLRALIVWSNYTTERQSMLHQERSCPPPASCSTSNVPHAGSAQDTCFTQLQA
eukprot:1141651-Pelagomonas_calceolata.AAC.3